MAGVFLARLRLSREGLDSHSFHQCADMSAAYSSIFSNKLVTKHACAHERVLQMELVDSAYKHQTILPDRSRLVIHTATAYIPSGFVCWMIARSWLR
ncbi:hypothetical protein SAMN05660330_03978 [Desulforhopalus singaporensis]|uniref:Uncharacterized protein n=1 Tax=Desulforhopalus singaporensis TaxID=91360 RepID=A0A1H0VBZ7_9BACT|nr:hypothetical protein SAMN05660330_03978 [Desulforhopalus singaporensis]